MSLFSLLHASGGNKSGSWKLKSEKLQAALSIMVGFHLSVFVPYDMNHVLKIRLSKYFLNPFAAPLVEYVCMVLRKCVATYDGMNIRRGKKQKPILLNRDTPRIRLFSIADNGLSCALFVLHEIMVEMHSTLRLGRCKRNNFHYLPDNVSNIKTQKKFSLKVISIKSYE